MKIVVTGKGGVGKTTIAASLAHVLAREGFSVLAVDADSFPNLAQSLGLPPEKAYSITPLVKNEELVEERTGARPGEGWGVLFSLTPKVDDLVEKYGVRVAEGLSLVVVGSIDAGKEGCMCPAIALAKAFLRHVLLKRGQVVIVDSEAGMEVFGRGLAEKFDLMLCVAEPSLKALVAAKKMIKLARDISIVRSLLVINKAKSYEEANRAYRLVFKPGEVDYHVVRYDPQVPSVEDKGLGVSSLPQTSTLMQDVSYLAQRICSMCRARGGD